MSELRRRDLVTGFAFAEGDEETLAKRLLQLLTDDDLAASMSDAGPAFVVENFDIAKCAAALEQLYDEITSNN